MREETMSRFKFLPFIAIEFFYCHVSSIMLTTAVWHNSLFYFKSFSDIVNTPYALSLMGYNDFSKHG